MQKTAYEFNPIGVVHSCYQEKFGIPRQSNLVTSATASIDIVSPYNVAGAFDGLEEFSHIWVIFCFHQNIKENWKPKVRPPRLGGNQRIGVYASRSSFRPNPIGMSVVKLDSIEIFRQRVLLHISGQDFVDQTPVLDIKPYIAYADAIPNTNDAYADKAPTQSLAVSYTKAAEKTIEDFSSAIPNLRNLISDTLAYDPRPSYHRLPQGGKGQNQKTYGMKISNFDVKFEVENNLACVLNIDPIVKEDKS